MTVKYTSFEFSKKLLDNGCRLKDVDEVNSYVVANNEIYFNSSEKIEREEFQNMASILNKIPCSIYPTYDILWDICIKHSKEFFGEEIELCENFETYAHNIISMNILIMLKNNNSQEEIENYIFDNCLFNPKNKKEKQ